jgi:hypothetical protein
MWLFKMEDWECLWRDKNTPPYEVLRVEVNYRPEGAKQANYYVYYRTYKKAAINYVVATDDLGAFVAGTALMTKLRAASDKYREKYK